MGISFGFKFETELILLIQRYMTRLLTGIAGVITSLGEQYVIIGILGLIYWCLNKDLGKKIIIHLSVISVINPVFKTAVKRLRPYMADESIKCLKAVEDGDIYDVTSQGYSFPSGHASNSIGLYGSLAKHFKSKALKCVFYGLCVLIGVSRFALGVHYPTDVLAGWLLGCLAIALFDVIARRSGRNRALMLFCVPGTAGFAFIKTNDYFTGYGMLLGATGAILFEEKYVRFEGTKSPLRCVLRVLVGAGLFLGLNTLFKLPFGDDILSGTTVIAFAVRTLRYAIMMFLLLGVYPLLFKLGDKFSKTDNRH